jgi:hypothetical protein
VKRYDTDGSVFGCGENYEQTYGVPHHFCNGFPDSCMRRNSADRFDRDLGRLLVQDLIPVDQSEELAIHY